jgi:hypothetical protein
VMIDKRKPGYKITKSSERCAATFTPSAGR